MGSGLGVATYGHAPFSERERGRVPKAYIYACRGRWVEHIYMRVALRGLRNVFYYEYVQRQVRIMPNTCVCCGHTKGKGDSVSIFRFPADKGKRQQWLEALNLNEHVAYKGRGPGRK